MKLKEYKDNVQQTKKIRFSETLFNTMIEISIEDIKNDIIINYTKEGIEFNLYNHNIGFILLSKINDELLWIDTINLEKHKNRFRIKGLGYFMIKYVIGLCKDKKFEIVNISNDLENYYKKIADNLKKDNIIIDYKFVGGNYKDLILNLK